ncbi:MAG: phasin family protein [Gammaproteobacteria bacterium]
MKKEDDDSFDEEGFPRFRPQGGATDLRKYTQQIWLAGLGAFSKAEEEGSKLFDTLVDLGRDVESRARDKVEKTGTRVEEVRTKVKGRTGETLEKMEKAFDDRLSGALSRLGIPNKREVEALNNRIEELTRTIEKLTVEEEAPRKGGKTGSSGK